MRLLRSCDQPSKITGTNRGIGRALVEEALARGAKRVYAGTRAAAVNIARLLSLRVLINQQRFIM
jgi:NAD(P)-dependent dehydrogenase (short-subunit alcohol dehydrogenase family)